MRLATGPAMTVNNGPQGGIDLILYPATQTATLQHLLRTFALSSNNEVRSIHRPSIARVIDDHAGLEGVVGIVVEIHQ